jgi:hypothetical protein
MDSYIKTWTIIMGSATLIIVGLYIALIIWVTN